MNTREQLLKKLNYDRFNIHIIGSDIGEDIKKAEQLIASSDLSNEERKTLCKQVGIYYLFYMRDKAQALQYLTEFQKLVPQDTLEYATTLNWIGHAKTIDGGYKEVDLFNQALDIYAKQSKTTEVQMGQAFAFRYISLMLHRNKDSEKAIENIKLAIEIQRSFVDTFPSVKIDLAESLHAWGVILARQNKLEQAEQKLLEAKSLEEAFCEEQVVLNENSTNEKRADHFMKFTTMQSLGDVWMRQGKYQESIDILTAAYAGQVACFKKEEQADIAKTLHFLGNVYMRTGQFDLALKSYEKSFAMKKHLGLDIDMVKVTEEGVRNAKLAIYNKEFTFDWNDYRTIKLNQDKESEIKAFIDEIPLKDMVDEQAKRNLAELCYKLATFYNHVYIKRDQAKAPDFAINYLKIAKNLLPIEEQAWIYNHLAFSYQQKLAAANKKKNPEAIKENLALAQEHYAYIISNYNCYPNSDPEFFKIFAFGMCVRALVEYEEHKLGDAIRSYTFALFLYEKIQEKIKELDDPNVKAKDPTEYDNQYARAKNRLGMIYAEDGRTYAAQHIFEELDRYWKKNQDPFNPYGPRFWLTFGDFLYKQYPNKPGLALEQYQKAHDGSCSSDGKDAEFTLYIKRKIDDIVKQQEVLLDIKQENKNNYSPKMFPVKHLEKEVPQEPEPKQQVRKSV